MSVEVPIQGAVEAAETNVSAAAYASEPSSASIITGEDSGGQSTTVAGGQSTTVAGISQSITVAGRQSITVAGGQSTTVAGSQSTNVAGTSSPRG